MPIALITGASGGLGEEFAKLCAKDGMNVVLIARDEEKLKALAKTLETSHKIKATVIPKDLSSPHAVEEIAQQLKKDPIEIDVLINNAGFGAYGLFHETDFIQEKQMLQVNIMALTELTKLLLPSMVARKRGKIMNVASTAAFQPGPLMAVYYASKAYVLSLSQALSSELSGTDVTVTCLCPGPTQTGFQKNAHMLQSRLFSLGSMRADVVALQGYRGMNAGKRLVTPGIKNKIGTFATRLVSRKFAAAVAWRLQKEQK
jgi:short-subunit dehydrogenase